MGSCISKGGGSKLSKPAIGNTQKESVQRQRHIKPSKSEKEGNTTSKRKVLKLLTKKTKSRGRKNDKEKNREPKQDASLPEIREHITVKKTENFTSKESKLDLDRTRSENEPRKQDNREKQAIGPSVLNDGTHFDLNQEKEQISGEGKTYLELNQRHKDDYLEEKISTFDSAQKEKEPNNFILNQNRGSFPGNRHDETYPRDGLPGKRKDGVNDQVHDQWEREQGVLRKTQEEYVLGDTKPPRNILLMGTSGRGKSSTGNTILGQKVFQTSDGAVSLSGDTAQGTTRKGDQNITVFDGLTLPDIRMQKSECEKIASDLLKNHFRSCHKGYDLLVLVLDYDNKTTDEERIAINTFRKLLGDKSFSEHFATVFTHGESFRLQQKKKRIPSFKDWLDNIVDPRLREIITYSNDKVFLFFNESPDRIDESVSQFYDALGKVPNKIRLT